MNYLKVIGFETTNLAFSTVTVEDQLTGEQYVIKAKKVVNAAGPWVDEVRKLDGEINNKHLVLTKGVHLVFDEDDFPLQQAIYFDTEHDGRMIFAIPRDGKAYVGTTDTFYDGDPTNIDITKEDRQYILDAIHYMFPQLNITEDKIESAWAGVRPLIHEEGKDPSEISRKDEIWQSESGLITIAGGKLTGYRKMAEKIVDLVVSQLNEEYQQSFGKSITKHLPISGGDMSGSKFFERFVNKRTLMGQQIGLTEEQSRYLSKFYGTNVDKVYHYISQATGDLPPTLYGQLYYAMNEECACTPTDFFIRRTGALLFNIHLVRRYKDAVVEEMAKYLNWNEKQKLHHIHELENELKAVTISSK